MTDIINSLQDLKATLEHCKAQENDERSIKSYDGHIRRTNEAIEHLKRTGFDKTIIYNFFHEEERNYGWSYLPNDHGRIAEEAFWNLKKKFGS